jgi:hypothetical protein
MYLSFTGTDQFGCHNSGWYLLRFGRKGFLDQAKLDQSQQTQNTQIAAEVDQKVSSWQRSVSRYAGKRPSRNRRHPDSFRRFRKQFRGCTNKFEFLSDVTFPDGTMTLPLTTFTKSWYVQNTGTCEWTKYYSIVYLSEIMLEQQRNFRCLHRINF